ncbi:unnamed protein product, partial [Mesorhabditis belari]|uniref:PHD-type domain-containing protein n=1 Tax=Mesorhabditis belari TaxID=2138241 RepID=A0AAF3E980_9BILA
MGDPAIQGYLIPDDNLLSNEHDREIDDDSQKMGIFDETTGATEKKRPCRLLVSKIPKQLAYENLYKLIKGQSSRGYSSDLVRLEVLHHKLLLILKQVNLDTRKITTKAEPSKDDLKKLEKLLNQQTEIVFGLRDIAHLLRRNVEANAVEELRAIGAELPKGNKGSHASDNAEKSFTGRTRIKQKEIKERKENKEERRIKEEIIETYKILTPKDRSSKAGTPARFPKPSTPVFEEQDDCSPPSANSSIQRLNKPRGRVPISSSSSSIASTKAEKAEARKEEREEIKAQRKEQASINAQGKKRVSSRVTAITSMLGVKRGANGNRKGERDDEGTTDEPTYCQCSRISFGEMVCCDNQKCEIEWFHFECVDLKRKPTGKWYCPSCRHPDSFKHPKNAIIPGSSTKSMKRED